MLVRSSVLKPSDRVLVRNLSERGGLGKLRLFWQDDIHQRVPNQPEPQNTINPVKNPVEKTINFVVEENNARLVQDISNTPPLENPRPQRTRRPPDRLTNYNPGAPLGVFQIDLSIYAPEPIKLPPRPSFFKPCTFFINTLRNQIFAHVKFQWRYINMACPNM